MTQQNLLSRNLEGGGEILLHTHVNAPGHVHPNTPTPPWPLSTHTCPMRHLAGVDSVDRTVQKLWHYTRQRATIDLSYCHQLESCFIFHFNNILSISTIVYQERVLFERIVLFLDLFYPINIKRNTITLTQFVDNSCLTHMIYINKHIPTCCSPAVTDLGLYAKCNIWYIMINVTIFSSPEVPSPRL